MLTIATVLTHYNGKPPAGRVGWVSMRCPFHDDRRASARVNLGLDAFACLGCGIKAGSAIGLIRAVEKIDSGAACEYAKTKIGETVDQIPQSVSTAAARRRRDRSGWKKVSRRTWD